MLNIKQHKQDYIITPQRVMHNPQPDWFSANFWQARDAITGTSQGRGVTWFVQADADQEWVLRHYQRGGWVAKLITDRYWARTIVSSRVWQEMHMLNTLFEQGLPVPAPIAGRISRLGLGWYRADLLTAKVPNTKPLGEWMNKVRLSNDTWFRIGQTLRRFHTAGIDHPDITVQNILLDEQQQIFVLDFDRAVKRPPGRWQQSNQRRFRRSIDKWCARHRNTLFQEAHWQACQKGWCTDK